MHFHLLVTGAEPEPEKWLDINQKHVISITEHLIFAHHSVTIHVSLSTHQAVVKRIHQHSIPILRNCT
jgi:hypothetical protein